MRFRHPLLRHQWHGPVGRVTLSLLLVCGGHLVMLGPVQASTAAVVQPQPMLRLAPVLASNYHPHLQLEDYWVSEKYDGIRVLWDGRRLLSRQGIPIAAPAWFTADWPAIAMDGELWAGRGQFEQVQAAVASASSHEAQWRQLRYMVFDAPMVAGVWSERQSTLAQLVLHVQQPWLQQVSQWQVGSHAQLQVQLQQLTEQGAEGLMLRRANAPYRSGRSDDLVKLKMVDDAEAIVVGYVPGNGKYQGMTGALLMQMPSGQQFRLGSGLNDALRKQPPVLGSVISYRHNGFHASGLPRFARFWRVLLDADPSIATPSTAETTQPSSR